MTDPQYQHGPQQPYGHPPGQNQPGYGQPTQPYQQPPHPGQPAPGPVYGTPAGGGYPPGPPGQPPVPAAGPPRRKVPGWLIAVVVVVFVLCGGMVVAAVASTGGDDDAPPAADDPTDPPTDQAADQGDAGDQEETEEPAGPDFPVTGDGVWEVGTDLEPGTYVTVTSTNGCYWARLSGFSGDFNELLANGNLDSGARGRVEITGDDAGVEFSGGCEWALADDAGPAEVDGPVPAGVWAVGPEVAPGTYTTTAPNDGFGCYWARLSGFSGDFSELVTNGNLDSGARGRVEITGDDAGVEFTGGCEWERAS